jgi:GxxExxY protein
MEIAFEIHNTIGPGFTENIYEESFIVELKKRRLKFEQQKPIQIRYKGVDVGLYKLDLVVEEKVIIELKAVSALNDVFKHQVRSYLKASGLNLGLLINFGAKRLEAVRILK